MRERRARARRRLRAAMALVGAGALLGSAAAAMTWWRWGGPAEEAPPPRLLDVCAERRPDGTLPAACAPIGAAHGATASLLFAGDTALADAALPALSAFGFDAALAGARPILAEADLAVVNHEAPIFDIPDGAPEPPTRWKQYVYRSPTAAARALSRAGVDVLGLANNHAFDHGAAGLSATVAAASSAGLAVVGAGPSEAEARSALVVRVGALRVALLARCEWKPDWDLWVDQYAHRRHAGVALLDGERLRGEIAAARREADLVILLVHWGEGYAGPTAGQHALARAVVAAGADLVIGHHPHVAQPVAMVEAEGRRAPVAFSLGNFAFGTPGHPSLDIGLLLRARVHGGRIARLELRALDVQNRRVHFRPVPLEGSAARVAFAVLVERSRALGADLVPDGDGVALDVAPRAREEP